MIFLFLILLVTIPLAFIVWLDRAKVIQKVTGCKLSQIILISLPALLPAIHVSFCVLENGSKPLYLASFINQINDWAWLSFINQINE